MYTRSSRFPNKYLILGVLCIILGGILLMWTLGHLPSFGILWPLPFLAVGMILLYMVIFQGIKERYILPGMILTLGGLFFLLLNTIITVKSIERIWPFFLLIAGVSFLPYAFKKKDKTKSALVISSVFMVLLSILFLPFSLNKTQISFSEFVFRWWPIIVIVVGVCLLLSFFLKKTPKK